jgi:hypothetical protein
MTVQRPSRFTMLLLAIGTVGLSWAAAAEDRVHAVWKSRELTFSYLGFTSHYSCEGLRDKVEQALIALGARRDLTATPFACSNPGLPELAPQLRIKLSNLEPATTAVSGDAVEGRWKTVSLTGIDKLGRGDCELAEQIRHEILPLFTTRNLKARTDCVPHQETGNIVLTVDALVPAKD